jgi:hypothetical protein
MKIDRPSGPTGPDAPGPVGQTERAGEPKVSFAETLGKSEGAAAVDPVGVEALVGRLRAGEIGMDAALDTLVAQAVQGAPLGARGKEELRELLRAALENDPTLRRLAREIEQG